MPTATSRAQNVRNGLSAVVFDEHGVEPGWNYGLSCSVRWGELDAYAHASHRSHLLWIEEARNQYLADAGYPLVNSDVPGPVVRSLAVGYERPLGLGDSIVVTARTSWFANTSFRMDYAIWHHGLVGRAHAICVWVLGKTGTRVALPDPLVRHMIALDGAVPRPADEQRSP